jgi:hypothetical protein
MEAKRKSIWQVLALCGIIGVAFYTLHVVLGGILWKAYNPITQTISELTGNTSPNAGLLTVFTTIYGALLIVFSASVFVNFKELRVKRLAMIGAVLFIIMELTSFFGYMAFPLDMGGALDNFQNTMHLVVSGVVVICTLGASYCIGIGLWKTPGHRKMGVFIFVCAIVITVFGGMTPALMANNVPFAGLTERINIFTLHAWTVVLSVYLFRGKTWAKG